MSYDTLSIDEAAAESVLHADDRDSEELLDLEALKAALAEAPTPVPLLRAALQHASAVLDERYKQNLNIT